MKLTTKVIESWKANIIKSPKKTNKVGTIRRQCTKRWQSIELRWWDSKRKKWTSKHWTIESAWKEVLEKAERSKNWKNKGTKIKTTKVSNIHRNRKAKKQDRGSSIVQALKPTRKSVPGLPKRWWIIRDGIGNSRHHMVWQLKQLGIKRMGISDVTKEAHNGCRAKKARRI